MKKMLKKGFTIVELVIVVAVIAILSAVLIPTFSNLIRTAETNSDIVLVKNVNTILASDSALEGKNETMYDALADVKDGGYDITKLTPTNSENEILWDQENDRFVLLLKDGKYSVGGDTTPLPADYKLWKIYTSMPAVAKQKYSIYWNGADLVDPVTVTVGFDAGSKNVADLTYAPEASKQEVIINTNGGKLTVNDAGKDGKVYHYGSLAEAVVSTDNNCFYANGVIASLTLTQGKVVAKADSLIGLKSNNGTIEGGSVYAAADASEEIKTQYADAVYEIGSKETLVAFREAWNNGAVSIQNVKLTADIDISGENWAPIGNWANPFHGTFDGNGKTIKGLTAVGTCEDGIYSVGNNVGYGETFGFFGIVGNGDVTVQNVSFTNVNIDLENGKNVGAVIGYAPTTEDFKHDDKGKIWGAGDKWVNNSTVGTHTLTLDGITVSGSVTGKAHVSGLVGKKYASGKFVAENCYSYVTINSSGDSCGGLFGYLKLTSDSIIKGCYNYGTVTSSGAWTGGIVGYIACLNANSELVIEDCHNYGTINLKSTNSRKGLILGNISSSNFTSLTFKNCTSEVESTVYEVNADNFTNNDLGSGSQTKFIFVNE